MSWHCAHAEDWRAQYAECSECGTFRPVRFVRLAYCDACKGWSLIWRACSRTCEIKLETQLRLKGERRV
jgi:hypothetical protein